MPCAAYPRHLPGKPVNPARQTLILGMPHPCLAPLTSPGGGTSETLRASPTRQMQMRRDRDLFRGSAGISAALLYLHTDTPSALDICIGLLDLRGRISDRMRAQRLTEIQRVLCTSPQRRGRPFGSRISCARRPFSRTQPPMLCIPRCRRDVFVNATLYCLRMLYCSLPL